VNQRSPYAIDMESSIRTNDKFNIDKVMHSRRSGRVFRWKSVRQHWRPIWKRPLMVPRPGPLFWH
jgi:hypothetical protein